MGAPASSTRAAFVAGAVMPMSRACGAAAMFVNTVQTGASSAALNSTVKVRFDAALNWNWKCVLWDRRPCCDRPD